jgi:type III pantothenate kinase
MHAMRALARQYWHIDPHFVVATEAAAGVRNGYADAGQLGVDRWLGVLAAHTAERRAALIASVGTAMTIDAVSADGQHRGGLIVPGPQLMIDSLLKGTSDIAERARQRPLAAGAFADNTFGAVVHGARLACAALIERCASEWTSEEIRELSIVVTGGACPEVVEHLRLPHRVVPDLVLRGLAALANEHRP